MFRAPPGTTAADCGFVNVGAGYHIPRRTSVESTDIFRGSEVTTMARDETLEEEEEFSPDAEEEDEALKEEAEAEPPEPAEGEEASLEEILAKKPEERPVPEEEEDEESILSLGREERLETLSVKVVPKQESEFVCRKCYLVKPIRSQLADKKRMFCRDCV
jgi:hypothetical protein